MYSTSINFDVIDENIANLRKKLDSKRENPDKSYDISNHCDELMDYISDTNESFKNERDDLSDDVSSLKRQLENLNKVAKRYIGHEISADSSLHDIAKKLKKTKRK